MIWNAFQLFVFICSIYKNTMFKLVEFMCSSSILTMPTYQHKRFLKDNEKKIFLFVLSWFDFVPTTAVLFKLKDA